MGNWVLVVGKFLALFLGMGNAKNARGHSAALWCSHFHADGVSQGESRLRARPKGMKTNEVCDRPLETFGAATLWVSCFLCDAESHLFSMNRRFIE